jgi:hypothetical protein
MGVNDWGGEGERLNAPALGGAGGWAEAVATALDGSDVPVKARTWAQWTGTQAEYDALPVKDPGTLYVVVG